ncbi:MAG: 4a-hydroxytetrahydrobiopterin dehydratase [Actinomycetota bacterium]|nr:4a-hydroxytetrahydrobiopterin dehydratase [Actinomycetota bacterium]
MSEWREDDGELVRERQFKDFAEALAYVNRVGELAEEVNHHPDILIHGWNKVRLSLFTHSEGRITDADHDMARRIDSLG